MIIRNGHYTKLGDHFFRLYSARQEAPIPFTHYILLWEDELDCPYDGFETNVHGDCIKILKRNDVINSFYIQTKAEYEEVEFLIESNPKDGYVSLTNEDFKLFEKLGFSVYQIGDEKNISEDDLYSKKYFKMIDRFNIRVKFDQLDNIWEERKESKFDLPMPAGLERRKLIRLDGSDEIS